MSFAKNTPVQFIPGVGWRTAKVLHELDLHTAGQLNYMPEKVLVELFGPSIRSVLTTLHSSTTAIKKTVRRQSSQTFTTAQVNGKVKSALIIKSDKKSFLKRLQLAAQFINAT